MMTFGDRVVSLVKKKQSAVCVGLDPRSAWIPPSLMKESMLRNEASPIAAQADAIREFCCRVIDLVEPFAVAVKPQFAFFEALHVPGIAALMEVCRYARMRGLLIIADAKRGDIDTTATAYAQAYLSGTAMDPPVADSITINAYMGYDGVAPFLVEGAPTGGGVFVLVKTSNPSSADFQDLLDQEGVPIYERMAQKVNSWNKTHGSSGYGSVGAVVGATWPQHLAALRIAMPHSIILVPGYGAQGGGAESVRGAFDSRGQGALITASRSVVFPWAKQPSVPVHWEQSIVHEAQLMRDDLRNLVGEYR
jgi:orotidine-5'-phosphate decarboxylase